MVKFWGKESDAKEAKERPERIKNMEESQLRGWLNASLMEMGSSYDRWLFNRGEAEDFDKVLSIVNDLWNELQSRQTK
jgi:hypothetical protein